MIQIGRQDFFVGDEKNCWWAKEDVEEAGVCCERRCRTIVVHADELIAKGAGSSSEFSWFSHDSNTLYIRGLPERQTFQVNFEIVALFATFLADRIFFFFLLRFKDQRRSHPRTSCLSSLVLHGTQIVSLLISNTDGYFRLEPLRETLHSRILEPYSWRLRQVFARVSNSRYRRLRVFEDPCKAPPIASASSKHTHTQHRHVYLLFAFLSYFIE